MTTVTRYDRTAIRATRTPQGYLVDAPVITRAGIFPYLRADGTVRRELRRPEMVFDEATLAAVKTIPITAGHVADLSSANIGQHMIGSVVSGGRRDGENMIADVVIYKTDALAGGDRELSLGYTVEIDETPGEWNGQKYDAVQTRIASFDHLALVPRGRAGNARLNLDAAEIAAPETAGVQPASTPTERHDVESTMTDVRLDSGLSYKAAPEVKVELTRLSDRVAALTIERDKAAARADAADAKADAAKADADKLRADAFAAARARVALETVAAAHKVEVKADTTDRAIREGVIRAVRGDAAPADLGTRSDAYVEVAYDYAIADAKQRTDDAGSQNRDVNTAAGSRSDDADAKRYDHAAARKKMVTDMVNASRDVATNKEA